MHALTTARDRIHTVIDATRAALADPEDTAQVFRIADALAFRSPERLVRGFRGSPDGARLLASREDILEVLCDRARLEAMPAGSLARAYLQFLDSEGITAAGLVEASAAGERGRAGGETDEVAYVRNRMRDTHDLWHTVTGYRGDLLGESALLAFTFAQTGHAGVGFLAGVGLVLGRLPGARRLIAGGFRRGRRAAWLPAKDWVALLPRPLDEVRCALGIDSVPVYTPVRELPGRAKPN